MTAYCAKCGHPEAWHLDPRRGYVACPCQWLGDGCPCTGFEDDR